MQFNKVNIPKLARNKYDYVAQGSVGGTTIISGSSGGTDSVSRLIEPIYSDDGEICGIRALYSMSVQGGVNIYTGGEGTNSPSIYDGLPIDNITLYWDNGVLKSKGSAGMDEGKLKTYLDANAYINNGNKSNYLPAWALAANKPAYTWNEISNKPSWIGADKPGYSWAEIGSKPSWIGVNKPSYVWTEIGGKPSWIGDNKPTYAFSEIGGKPTTLGGYGITDAVTLNTSQVITGAKDFTGGLSVDGCPIAYDTATKVWKITGNLLVTGGLTAYGDMLTGSAILDALPVDATLSKANGVLSVVGGGFLSSITVKLGAVAYNSADGVVSLPAYPTALPASDVPAWAKAASKPGYTISEITGLQGVLDGKALASHAHNYAGTVKIGTTAYNVVSNVISLPEYPTALKSPNALTISLNGASQGAYDGSAAKSFNINYSNVGAPSTTGANASGTWSINISGDANTLDGYHAASFLVRDKSEDLTETLIRRVRSDNTQEKKLLWTGFAITYQGSELANINSNVATATKLQNTRYIWGRPFDGTGNLAGRFELDGSANSLFSIYDDGAINLQSYASRLLTLNKSGNNISFGNVANIAKFNYGGTSFYNLNGDATLAMYDGLGVNGNETVCFQTTFDGQDPKSSSYPSSYPNRAILALQHRGGRVAIGKTTADYSLDVIGGIKCSDWVRTSGKTGWYSDTYGGGIYMEDDTYVKVWNNKRLFSNGGFSVHYGGSSWISMATRTDCIVADMNNSSVSAHALFRTTFNNGNVLAYGGLGNEMGFYGFSASDISAGNNTTSWSTKWNSVGDFVTSKKIAAGNNIYAHGQAYTLAWNTIFNPINSTYGDTELNTVSHNQYKPMLGWHDQISGQGFITKYNIGSYRTNYKWGQMVLAVSSNDYGNSVGAAVNISGDGTVTIEGNLLVTGGITQYSNSISMTDTFSANILRANDCLLVGAGTNKDAPERYICCYGKTGSSYINLGYSGSAANTAEISFNYFGSGSGSNEVGIGFYGGASYGKLIIRANKNNSLEGSLTLTGTITPGSDMRRKNVIDFINLSVDQIANAPLFDYYWKDLDDGAHTGTSAQYWQNVLPNTVRDNGISGLALDYNGVNIAGLITVSREIVKLKRENEELRQEINQLKERAS